MFSDEDCGEEGAGWLAEGVWSNRSLSIGEGMVLVSGLCCCSDTERE